MRIRIFTLKFHPLTEQFDDTALQDFIKDKELLSVREHFFVKHDTPYLLVFLTYRPGTHDIEKAGKKQKTSWRDLLSDEQVPLFNTLRDWRAERAKQEGVPQYVIFTNQQLAQVVIDRPSSLAALGKIRGLGKAKLEKYGNEMLAVLSSEDDSSSNSSDSTSDSEDQQEDMFHEEQGGDAMKGGKHDEP